MNEKKFKYLDAGRQSDLNRLLRHITNTYGLSAMLEQLIDLVEGPKPYEQRLVADLKKTFETYEARYDARYNLDSKDDPGEISDNYDFDMER